jgi:hypothetical protein
MGYYTLYSVEQVRNALPAENLETLIISDESASYALESDGSSRNWDKWYEHENSLCAWSAKYPNTIFRLHAEGEDVTGIWDKYFLGGELLHTELFNDLPEPDLDGSQIPQTSGSQ